MILRTAASVRTKSFFPLTRNTIVFKSAFTMLVVEMSIPLPDAKQCDGSSLWAAGLGGAGAEQVSVGSDSMFRATFRANTLNLGHLQVCHQYHPNSVAISNAKLFFLRRSKRRDQDRFLR